MNASDLPPAFERFTSAYKGLAPWETGQPQSAFVERADLVSGDVLDSGCGTGENALYFARRGHAVTGYDFIASAVMQAREKARRQGIAAKFLVMNALHLHEFNACFDSVLDSGVFHSFTDEERSRYVSGLHSVLKPGGKLFLCCFSDQEPGDHGPRRIREEELRQAFTQGWALETLEATRFEVRSDLPDVTFSVGGPHAWFCVARRS